MVSTRSWFTVVIPTYNRPAALVRCLRSIAENEEAEDVIVVDDVVTTAATLNACAAALCEGGARIVSFVTFGRAPALGDRW